jgi:hypothetical protein
MKSARGVENIRAKDRKKSARGVENIMEKIQKKIKSFLPAG